MEPYIDYLRQHDTGEPSLEQLVIPLLPWLFVIGLVIFFAWLVTKARKRKTSAVVFASLAQAILPAPYSEKTLQIVEKRQKEQTYEEQDENTPK